jgi:hypothetical protein
MEEESGSERNRVGHAFEEVEMKKWWFGEAFFSVCFVNYETGFSKVRREIRSYCRG